MPPPRSPVIHVGLHKAGSTFLQERVFSRADLGFHLPLGRRRMRRLLVYPGPLGFDADAARAAVGDALSATPADLVPVLSEERLSGHPDVGSYDAAVIADRLRAAVGDARILLLVRHQPELVRSLWGQHVRFGGTMTLQRYLDGRLDSVVPGFDPASLHFDRLVRLYDDRFGADDVVVVPFEQLTATPEASVRDLQRRLGARGDADLDTSPANAGLGLAELWFLRQSNRFDRRPTSVNPQPLSVPPVRVALRAGRRPAARLPAALSRRADDRAAELIDDLVADRYRASNAILSERIGVDLAALGWRC